jgi:hypothetical protein
MRWKNLLGTLSMFGLFTACGATSETKDGVTMMQDSVGLTGTFFKAIGECGASDDQLIAAGTSTNSILIFSDSTVTVLDRRSSTCDSKMVLSISSMTETQLNLHLVEKSQTGTCTPDNGDKTDMTVNYVMSGNIFRATTDNDCSPFIKN